jgi:hypothetical protein
MGLDVCNLWNKREGHPMSQDRLNQALDELVEETALQIIFTVSPGPAGDPLPTVKRMLWKFLENAQEHLQQETLREQVKGEEAHQSWELEGGRPSSEEG